jgi:hypothetical protein
VGQFDRMTRPLWGQRYDAKQNSQTSDDAARPVAQWALVCYGGPGCGWFHILAKNNGKAAQLSFVRLGIRRNVPMR